MQNNRRTQQLLTINRTEHTTDGEEYSMHIHTYIVHYDFRRSKLLVSYLLYVPTARCSCSPQAQTPSWGNK
jgi:hypothetical protein